MADANKVFSKDTKISDLDVEQFTALMVSVAETKAYYAAQREQQITERIFRDAEGIIAAGVVPFRVTREQDVDEFAATMKAALKANKGAHFAVAAALVVGGSYRSAE